MSFSGPNAADALNGWRLVTAPTLGTSANLFGFVSNSTPFSTVAFAAPTISDFYLEVSGSLSIVPEPATTGFIGLFATGLMLRRRR